MFTVELKAYRNLDKYNARLMAKGFLQVKGIDFFETFSLVVNPMIVRVIITLALYKGWDLKKMDVNNVFMNAFSLRMNTWFYPLVLSKDRVWCAN